MSQCFGRKSTVVGQDLQHDHATHYLRLERSDLRLVLVELDDALRALEQAAPDKARVVELRYFGGLSVDETAECMDVSPATVHRHWAYARAWLYRRLTEERPT